MQVNVVMSGYLLFRVLADIYRAGMQTPKIIVILFTQGLPYVQCTENRLTCKDYIANFKISRSIN